jgi:hypothetical protein
MATQKELAEEQNKLRYLRAVVDLTAALLRQEDLSLLEALKLVTVTKRHVLFLFPDKEQTYDLIYKPRFDRIIKERFEMS